MHETYSEVEWACTNSRLSLAAEIELKTMESENSNWNSDMEYALGFYKLLGKNLGIWPLESHGFGSNIKTSFVVITQLWMSISLMETLFTIGNCGTVTDIVDVLTSIIGGYLSVMKIIIPIIYQQNMLLIVNSTIDDWSQVVNKKSRNVMLKYAFMGRIFFLVEMCGAYVLLLPLIFMRLPFVNSLFISQSNNTTFSREIPLGPDCWISDDLPTYLYVSKFILQSIQLFIVCAAYIGCDTYFFGIGMHLCGQFELLSLQLDDLYCNDNDFERKQKLNDFVKRHNHLLKLANNFDDIYNMIILAQIAGDTVIICILAIVLLMSLGSGNIVTIVGLIIRIYLVYIQLFIYSYVGETLSTQAENLQIAVYNCPWYTMSSHIVNDMRFIIMRNNHRFNLTAGKMYSMNIESFKNIVKTISSYFSVLRVMLIEKQ